MNRRLRIAMIMGAFPLSTENFVINQITGLIDRGHDVIIIAHDNLFLTADVIQKDVLDYQLDRITIFPKKVYETYFLWAVLKDLIKFPRDFLRIFKVVRNVLKKNDRTPYSYLRPFLGCKDFDIVHCQFGGTSKYAIQMLENKVTNAKIYVSFRGKDLNDKAINYNNYNSMFAKADKVLPVCNYFARRLKEIGCQEDKLHILGSGIKINNFPYKRRYKDKEFKIISVGRLVEKKGHIYLLKSLKQLITKWDNIQCTIIGEGNLKNYLQEFIDRNNLNGHVTLKGFLQQNAVIAELNKNHLMVIPSVTADDGDIEGIPNVLKEAMALGVPVIGTNHSGIPELVRHGKTGFLCNERSESELMQIIEYVKQNYNTEEMTKIIENARTEIEKHFDNEVLIEKLIGIYTS